MSTFYQTTPLVNDVPRPLRHLYAVPSEPNHTIADEESPDYDTHSKPRRRVTMPKGASFARIPISVLKNRQLSAWARLLYPLIVDYMSDRGAFPGRERLADDLGVSVPTVDRALAELTTAELIVPHRQGRGRTNRYTLPHDLSSVIGHEDDLSSVIDQNGYDLSPVMTPDLSPVITPIKEEPDLKEPEVVNPPSPQAPKTKSGLMDGFDEFYQAYPKHKSKGDAIRAWKKLKPSPELRTTIMAAIEAQKRQPDWIDKPQFIPYPATWLNGGKWEDEVDGATDPQSRLDENGFLRKEHWAIQ
jgi:DNA-binding transcriptional ArsR family regulator